MLLGYAAVVATGCFVFSLGCRTTARANANRTLAHDVGVVLSGARAPATLSPADQLRWETARDRASKLAGDLDHDD